MINKYDIKDVSRAGDVGIIIFEDVENQETFTLPLDLTNFKESELYVLCAECYNYNDSLYITDIDSNFELTTKEYYDRQHENISDAIQEVLLHIWQNRKMIKLYNYYEIMYRRHYSVCKNSLETDIYQAKLSAVKECLDIMTEDNSNDR